jgi:hypothetical protein
MMMHFYAEMATKDRFLTSLASFSIWSLSSESMIFGLSEKKSR